MRDAVARYTRRFVAMLEEQAKLAARLGELAAGTTPRALAFAIHGLAQEANLRRELLDEDDAFELARGALDELLAHATQEDPR